jgi:hypothetical protein
MSSYAAFYVHYRNTDGEQFVISSGPAIVPAASINLGTEKIEKIAHGFLNDDYLLYTAGATPITGLTDGNYYYVVNKTADDFQVSLTKGGSAIALSGTPVGDQTFTQAVQVHVRADGLSTDAAESPLETDEDGQIVAGTLAAIAADTKVHFRVENWRGRAFSVAQMTT